MENREHHDSISFNAIEDRIREATGLHATNIAVSDGKAFRISSREIDHAIDLERESHPKTRLPFLVPQRCAAKFGACGAPKDNLQGHCLRRAVIDALTSSQETTSSGCAS